METQNSTVSTTTNKVRWGVFLPAFIALMGLVVIGFVNNEAYLAIVNAITNFILSNFAWAFNINTLFCLVTAVIVYFSPSGKVRFGGSKARPMMNYINWVWITLCAGIAAGILFWGAGEPMYHMYEPAAFAEAEPGSPKAAIFAMEVMFLEWTFSPYSLYIVSTLIFAFVFYNMKRPYSISSVLTPVFGTRVDKWATVIDTVSLFTLVAGVATCLATGTMSLGGGIEQMLGIPSGNFTWTIIIIAITIAFILSSISGVMKGIKMFSQINSYFYIGLLIFLFIVGPTAFYLNFTTEALGNFIADFIPMSLATGDIYGDSWAKSWPIFYWCNWLSVGLLTGVFCARITRGYTVRDTIKVGLVIPAIFGIIWMGIFSSSTIYYEMNGVGMRESLLESGTESLTYMIFQQLPLSVIIVPVYIVIVFISFVTFADSNTTAMAGLCVTGITQENTEAPSWIKFVWGVAMAAVTWILLTSQGIDGIKAVSNLGGFPNMFLVFLSCIGLLKIARNPKKYDTFKEDYDEFGNPIESVRLVSEQELIKQGKPIPEKVGNVTE